MIITPEFIKAVRSKRLCTLMVVRVRTDDELKDKVILWYNSEFGLERESLEFPTEIKTVENYSSCAGLSPHNGRPVYREVTRVSFHMPIYHHGGPGHNVKDFLRAIRKGDDLYFTLRAYCTESQEQVGIISHTLYGYINGRCYLLDTYAGFDNFASPIQ